MTLNINGYHSVQGRKYELIALSMLTDSIDNNLTNFKGYYDIEWRGYKIDVKSRKFVNKKGWAFKSRSCKADYYLCFCLYFETYEKGDKIAQIFLFPREVFNYDLCVYQATPIRQPSKYKQYQVFLNSNGKLDDSALEIINNLRIPIPPNTKICRSCNLRKSTSEFYKATIGVRPYCKECHKKKSRDTNHLRRDYWKKYYHTVKKFKK